MHARFGKAVLEAQVYNGGAHQAHRWLSTSINQPLLSCQSHVVWNIQIKYIRVQQDYGATKVKISSKKS